MQRKTDRTRRDKDRFFGGHQLESISPGAARQVHFHPSLGVSSLAADPQGELLPAAKRRKQGALQSPCTGVHTHTHTSVLPSFPPYVTLHYLTLHYLTLHYITSTTVQHSTFIHIYIYIYTQTYKYLCVHTYIHTYIHAYMHTCIHAYMHTCIHAYMHTCIHAYMHTCVHACMHACRHTVAYITATMLPI